MSRLEMVKIETCSWMMYDGHLLVGRTLICLDHVGYLVRMCCLFFLENHTIGKFVTFLFMKLCELFQKLYS